MSRGNWGIILAAFGIALSYPIHQHAHAQGGPAENQAKAADKARPAASAAVENSLARIARAIEATKSDPYAEANENRAERDLTAQQDMAKWAMWMFVAAALTTFLSAIGVFLIWRNLIHTRRAANFTGEAVDQARMTTDAALKSVLISEDTAKRQLRAYVYLRHMGHYGFDGDKPRLKVLFRNSGQTPARKLRSVVQGCVRPRDDIAGLPCPTFQKEQEGFHLVGPGGEHDINYTWAKGKLSDAQIEGLKNGSLAIFVTGVLEYEDVFGEPHTLQILEKSRLPVEGGAFASANPYDPEDSNRVQRRQKRE